MKSAKLASVLLASLFAIPVFAQNTNTPRIDHRQIHQQKRIAHGVQSGELTAKEAAHLEKRQARIEADKQAAKADGNVTARERAHLRHEEDVASRKIYKKSHNSRKATPAS